MQLPAGKLYIMSGVQGSGKSTFLKQFSKEMILSSDKIRSKLIKNAYKKKNGKIKMRITDEISDAAFKILKEMLDIKLKEKLTVFLDITAISDKERAEFVKMASSHGIQSEILILDTSFEECLKNNEARETSIDESVLYSFNERFEKTSIYPYRVISSSETVELIPNTIQSDIKLDVVGDVHGLYSLFLEHINELGYILENGIPVHLENRALLFLGDFIDRGPESVEMLLFVKKAVQSGKHYAIIGNHEKKLLTNLRKDIDKVNGSYSTLKTFIDVLKHEVDNESIISFLQQLPGYYIQDEFAFTHAHIGYFDPFSTPLSELVYGSYPKKEIDCDEEYQYLYDEGVNKYTLIRGHILQQSVQNNVFALEEKQAFEGFLVILSLDEMKNHISSGMSQLEAFYLSKKCFKSDFNFDSFMRKNNLNYNLEQLLSKKLITEKKHGALKMVKYAKSVFYKNLWKEGGELLSKSRGLVVDLAGNIVQHSFDKVFNYRENDAGLDIPDNEVVQYVEKKNGFLGNITLNPFTKDLLITTTGSFDSDFVEYIKDFLTPAISGKLKKFLNKNDVTLSFEVIHPKDPHIIHYEESEMGLCLIGIRGKNYSDKNWQESNVDVVGLEIGLTRPLHGFCTFAELKMMIIECQHEGYMVRRLNQEEYDLYLKYKSPFYLTTKFIGRLNDRMVKFMYANPTKFKETIDEEFYPIVDTIISSISEKDYSAMDKISSVNFVRNIILEHLK